MPVEQRVPGLLLGGEFDRAPDELGASHRPALFDLPPGEAPALPLNRGFPGTSLRRNPGTFSAVAPMVAFRSCPTMPPERTMNIRQSCNLMKSQLRPLLLGLTFSLASVGVSHAMSELLSISEEPVWPVSSNPDGSIVYAITTASRGGAGLLEVTLTAGDMPPGVTVTFSPSVLRFTGNQATNQTATMTVYSTNLIPIDCFPSPSPAPLSVKPSPARTRSRIRPRPWLPGPRPSCWSRRPTLPSGSAVWVAPAKPTKLKRPRASPNQSGTR